MDEKSIEKDVQSSIADQALKNPVKYTFMLTKEIFTLNKGLFLGIAAIVILLTLLSVVPIVGLVASILSGILLFGLLFFVGGYFYRSKTMDEFVGTIRSMTIANLFRNYLKPSLGAYVGWVILVLPVMLIFGLIVGLIRQSILIGTIPNGDSTTLPATLSAVILPLIIIAFVLYIMPLVIANMIKRDNFVDAFKAVFTVFSKDVWRRAFTKAYFKYMGLIGFWLLLLITTAIVFSGLLMRLFFAIDPSMMESGIVIVLILMVILQIIMNIFFAVSSIIAERITQQQ